mgnify:CR=1 FL=1|tara:strand:- start:22 stop:1629 length:1608 start_codon:yes stop_codon:yes gene_type:complete
MTFTPGSVDPERTDTIEAQTAEPDRDIDKRVEEEFEQAQSSVKTIGEGIYNFGKGVLFLSTGGSIQATQALDAVRARIEGKPFTPPSPNPNNLGGLITLEPITTEGAFTRPDVTGTESDLITDRSSISPSVLAIFGGTATPEQKKVINNLKLKLDDKNKNINDGLEDEKNKEDEELLSRYRELENPDSYIVDPADPDYGKLKSDVLPKRQQEANRKALLEGKGDLLLNMLNDKELEQIFPKSYRSFYRKLKPDKKGRFVDLKKSLDVATIREMYPGPENEDFRRTVFALAADPRFSSTVYQETRKSLIAEWLEGLDDIQDRVVKETKNTKLLEAHHVRSIRHVAALFDGLDFQERTILRNRLLNNMFPVGNNPDNLVLLNDEIHDEIHRQLDEKIGKTAKKFIDPQRNYTIEEREEIASRMGTIINQLTQEAYDSMAEYMADKYTEVSPSARMAAEMDITETTGVLDATLEGYLEFVNRKGLMSIQRRIDDMDYFPEDEPAPDLRLERLTRGRGKKQLELERKYGKQLDLFKDGQ